MSNHLNAEIARNVQAMMTARGVTQQQLTDRTGIAERTLRRRLAGSSSWTTDELDAIAEALATPGREITVQDLLGPSRAA